MNTIKAIIILVSLYMFFTTSSIFEGGGGEVVEEVCVQADLTSFIVNTAESHLGKPYDPSLKKGFDCSALVGDCYRNAGIKLARSSQGIYSHGEAREFDDARIGDIIVFKGRNVERKRAGHVGIIHHFEGDKLYFIHSSTSKGVVIDQLDSPYYKKRFLGVVSYLD